MDTNADIVALDDVRRIRNRTKYAVTALQLAQTGARPVRFLASDGLTYWCKHPQNPQGVETVVNEVVAAYTANLMQAPVREWAFVEVPDELIGTSVPGSTDRVKKGPYFGSLTVHSAVEVDEISYVDRDNNYERVPRLIALWLLCNAEDIQMMFDLGEDYTLWSLDQGFWFGSHERTWGLGRPDQFAGRPELPSMDTDIPAVHWDRAIAAVEKLTPESFSNLASQIPPGWGIEVPQVNRLRDYILSRRAYTVDELTRFKAAGRIRSRR